MNEKWPTLTLESLSTNTDHQGKIHHVYWTQEDAGHIRMYEYDIYIVRMTEMTLNMFFYGLHFTESVYIC